LERKKKKTAGNFGLSVESLEERVLLAGRAFHSLLKSTNYLYSGAGKKERSSLEKIDRFVYMDVKSSRP
jgi:hypothetical protein